MVFCLENQKDWTQFLPWAEYAHSSLKQTNIQPHSSHRFRYWDTSLHSSPGSPSYQHTSHRSVVPTEWASLGVHPQCLEQVAQRYKRFANKHRGKTPVYIPSDRVWVSTKDWVFQNVENCLSYVRFLLTVTHDTEALSSPLFIFEMQGAPISPHARPFTPKLLRLQVRPNR